MIEITDKHNCCGCSACAECCPKACISMTEDEEGFLYPTVDESKCIGCGLCEKVCPVINQCEPHKPLKVYAAKNPNEEIRIKSSSGGIFTMLAEQTISHGGVVFGAKFDTAWNVVHDYAETLEGITAFRGSKYVQSTIGNCYKQAEIFLKQGREVLFSGTPCQIAGLKKFLRKEYDKLIAVDVVCHGVPSPGVWREYLKAECTRQCTAGKNTVFSHPINPKNVNIENIEFRNKATGWKKFSFALTLSANQGAEENSVLHSETLFENIFMQGFLANIYLRPSCYACSAKSGKSKSDLSIADFWGVGNFYPNFDDDKGCCLILVNSSKGKIIYDSLSKDDIEVSYSQGLAGNSSIEHSCKESMQRVEFWRRYKSERMDCIPSIVATMQPSLTRRILSLYKRMVKRIIGMR